MNGYLERWEIRKLKVKNPTAVSDETVAWLRKLEQSIDEVIKIEKLRTPEQWKLLAHLDADLSEMRIMKTKKREIRAFLEKPDPAFTPIKG